VRFDPRTRELRRDVPVAAGVLRDAVHEEQVRPRRTDGRPPVGA
jgi:hypothetical protein